MSQTTDKVDVPDAILENEVVGYGISSWVLRFDAVAKCYLSSEPHLREREIAVYERLTSPDGESHDAIVAFYGVLDGRSVLLQFARNGSIRQYYRKHNQDTPVHTRLCWAEQITSAIIFLHAKGVLHGDISCNNVFLDESFNAKLGDFAGSSIDGLPFLTVGDIGSSRLLQECYGAMHSLGLHHEDPQLGNFHLVGNRLMALDLEMVSFDKSADDHAYFMSTSVDHLGLQYQDLRSYFWRSGALESA
ncbi:Uncharacterized protein TPAR_07978 [Tolypocladium paradoxum]|uniref:EKC/KEOPS complex subunit BUD32 n=1 Tax=Tolypocladium paradoxum TaxID=94208 RepID=A0A2S4KNM9_9HYPO|nr:Uncharacterized protein TPAR_07978 [Tolypocladium paradoxum]